MTQLENGAAAGHVSDAGLISISNLRRWGMVGLLFVATFINYLDRATISVALPLLSLDLHLNPETKGLVLSAFFWSYALMQIPVGWCADRWNLRWLYAGLFAVWSVACGLTGFAGSLLVLLLLRILLGIGESIYLPGGTKIIGMLFPSKERGFPSGLFDSGSRMGLAMGAPLIAMLIAHYGWRKMFPLVGFTSILWLVPWLLIAPTKLQGVRPAASPSPPTDWPKKIAGVGAIVSALVASLIFKPSNWIQAAITGGKAAVGGYLVTLALVWPARRIHFNRNLLGICLGFFCFDYYWYLMVTWLPDYLVTVRHLSLVRAGFSAALPYFVFGVCQPLGGWITDWFIRRGWDETRTRKTMITVAFLFGLLVIPAGFAKTTAGALGFLMGGSLVGLAVGNLFAIVQCCAPPNEVGIWTGFENFGGNIGGVLAPLATGYLIFHTGTYLPGFALAAGLLLAGIFAYWLIVGELPDASYARPTTS
jgi:MFS family permease